MEHVDGRPLAEFLKEGKLPVARATRWAVELAVALARPHAAGIVHGHVNPDNAIVTADDTITLRNVTASLAADPSAIGQRPRLNYLAPEQLRGEPAGAAADVFGFGAVAYLMFAGRDAFPADIGPSELLKLAPPRLSELQADLDSGIAALIEEVPAERRGAAADNGVGGRAIRARRVFVGARGRERTGDARRAGSREGRA